MTTLTHKVLVWIYSGVAAILGGVGTAVSAVVGGQVIGSVPFTPRQLWATAIGGAIFSLAAYLKSSPLPNP